MNMIFKFIIATLLGSIGLVWYQFIENSELKLTKLETLRVLLSTIPSKLSIHDQTSDLNAYRILTSLHLGLLSVDHMGRVLPAAAISWNIFDEGRSYKFKIRKSLYFHDKTPCTCDVIKHSFENLKASPRKVHSIINSVNKIECRGEEELTFYFSSRPAEFLIWLSTLEASIIKENYGENILGIGPYQLTKRDSDLVMLQKVNDHFMLEKSSADKIIFRSVDGPIVAAEHIKNLEADFFALDGAANEISSNDPSINLVEGKALDRVTILTMGKMVGSDQSRKVLKCIYNKLDRMAFLLDGQSRIPAYGVVSPDQTPNFQTHKFQDINVNCDVLDQLPKRDIHLIFIDQFMGKQMIQSMEKQLGSMGLKVTSTGLKKSDFISKILAFDYDLALFSFGIEHTPISTLGFVYRTDTPVPILWQTRTDLDADMTNMMKITDPDEMTQSIKKFESSLATNPLLVPLFFEKSKYLINNCLVIKRREWSLGNERYFDIARKGDCE